MSSNPYIKMPKSLKKQKRLATITLFVILFVFAYLITNSRLIFKTSISALYSKRGMSQLEREGDIYNEPIVFTIYFLQILIGSFLIYLTLSHYTEISIKPNLLFIYTVVGYMSFIISKYILIKILASVFYSKIQLNKLLLHNLLNVNMLNVAIFPYLLSIFIVVLPHFYIWQLLLFCLHIHINLSKPSSIGTKTSLYLKLLLIFAPSKFCLIYYC